MSANNKRAHSRAPYFLISSFFLFALTPSFANALMTVSGPIAVSTIVVTGNVTVSSMTVSTMVVTNVINVVGATSGMSGRILQMKFSSTTVTTEVSSTTFTAVAYLVQSLTLSNASNYVRIAITGSISSIGAGYVTVYRDTNNLGDATFGLTGTLSSGDSRVPSVGGVGVAIIDSPGDTMSHTYQVFIHSENDPFGVLKADFPYASTGFLLLEEISR